MEYGPFQCIPLKNHARINLGGDYDIELIHMGGHTPGLSCYLDKKGRRLYTGDAVFESLQPGLGIGLDLRAKEYIPHAEYMDIRYLYEQLKALAARSDEYDFTGDGHGSIDSDKRVVSDLRETRSKRSLPIRMAIPKRSRQYSAPVILCSGESRTAAIPIRQRYWMRPEKSKRYG